MLSGFFFKMKGRKNFDIIKFATAEITMSRLAIIFAVGGAGPFCRVDKEALSAGFVPLFLW
jgi:hypothetical protein